MKKYVILTADIHPIGGMQMYVDTKKNFLAQNGWGVYIIFDGLSNGKACIETLQENIRGGILGISVPPSYYTKNICKDICNRLLKIIEYSGDETELLIESQSDTTALWGEMLAEKVHGKHVCLCCNELFRGENKFYLEFMPFFDFKHKRREIAGIHYDSLVKLFDGYKDVEEKERYSFKANEGSPIKDVKNEVIEHIKKLEWNIGYLGRVEKGYFLNILKGVCKFATENKDKKILFIIVGDTEVRKKEINNAANKIKNLKVVTTGNLVPIPQMLYQKLDVMIAGSGCAYHSCFENVPVILADAGNYKANGVLGYTTWDELYAETPEQQMSFEEALTMVVKDRICDKLEFKMDAKENYMEEFKKHIQFFYASAPKKEYFNVYIDEKVKKNESIKYYINKYFLPGIMLHRFILKYVYKIRGRQ